MERDDPAARGPGQGRDGARPGLGALRRQRVQRRRQHHDADGARGGRHQGHRRRAASSRPSAATCATPASSPATGSASASTRDTTGATPTPAPAPGSTARRCSASTPTPPTSRSGSRARSVPLDRADRSTPAPATPLGDRDPLENGYGSGRLDYYLDNGSVLSVDGGASQVQNEIFVTGIGRVQVAKAIKPYARVAMAADRYNVFAYWNSRTSLDPQVSLQSGLPLEERSDIFHVEGQTNWNFLQERGRVVAGASVRNTRVNTSGTLMNLANDDRSDNPYSIYGQVEYKLLPQLRVVGALRWDDGDLFDTPVLAQGRGGLQPQREPLVPVLGQPGVPDAQLLGVLPAGAGGGAVPPARRRSRAASRTTTRQCRPSLPPQALAGLTITDDLPWNFSAGPRRRSRSGNADLKVEKVTGWELGLQRQPVRQGLRHRRRLHQQAQGLRHRPAARGQPRLPVLRARPTASTCRRSWRRSTSGSRTSQARARSRRSRRRAPRADPAAARRLRAAPGGHPDPGRQRAGDAAGRQPRDRAVLHQRRPGDRARRRARARATSSRPSSAATSRSPASTSR